jgi:hypothetical protein
MIGAIIGDTAGSKFGNAIDAPGVQRIPKTKQGDKDNNGKVIHNYKNQNFGVYL